MTKYAPPYPLFAIPFCVLFSINCLAADNMGLRVDQDYVDANGSSINISQDTIGISGGTGVYINAISDIDVVNSGPYLISGSISGGRGVTISNNSNVVFKNNQGGVITSKSSTGINIYKTSDSNIENNHNYSIVSSSGSDAIRFSSSSNTTITNFGTIQNNGTDDDGSAIYILGSSSSPNIGNNLENSGIIIGNDVAKLAIRITNYVTDLNINNAGIINGDIISSNNDNQINLNNSGIVNGNISLGEGSHNINITGGSVNGELRLGVDNNPNITANQGEVITFANGDNPIIFAKNSIFAVNGKGIVKMSGDIVDEFENDNNLVINVSNSGTLQFVKDVTIDGSLNSSYDGNIIDIGDNIITLKNSAYLDSNTTIYLNISDNSYGQLVTQGDEVNVIIADNSIIRPKISRVISEDGESFTIVKNQSQVANGYPNDNIMIRPEEADINITDSARYDFALENDNYDLNLFIKKKTKEDLGLSGNGTIINELLDKAFANDSELLTALNDIESSAELNKAMKELEPQLGNAIVASLKVSFGNSIKTVSNRIFALRSTQGGVSTGNQPKNISTWGQLFASQSQQNQALYSGGYKINNTGLTFGVDKKLFAEKFITGISFGYSESRIGSESADQINIDSYQANIYSSYQLPKNYSIDSALSYSHNTNKSIRNININPINRTANAKYNSHQYGLTINGNKNYKIKSYTITPALWVQYLSLNVEGYQESGAGASNLAVLKQNYNNLYSGLDTKISRQFNIKTGELVPQIKIGYNYGVLNKQPIATSRFTGGGGSFVTKSDKPEKHSFDIGMGISFTSKNNVKLTANCEAEKRKSYTSYSGLMNVEIDF